MGLLSVSSGLAVCVPSGLFRLRLSLITATRDAPGKFAVQGVCCVEFLSAPGRCCVAAVQSRACQATVDRPNQAHTVNLLCGGCAAAATREQREGPSGLRFVGVARGWALEYRSCMVQLGPVQGGWAASWLVAVGRQVHFGRRVPAWVGTWLRVPIGLENQTLLCVVGYRQLRFVRCARSSAQ